MAQRACFAWSLMYVVSAIAVLTAGAVLSLLGTYRQPCRCCASCILRAKTSAVIEQRSDLCIDVQDKDRLCTRCCYNTLVFYADGTEQAHHGSMMRLLSAVCVEDGTEQAHHGSMT